MNKLSVVSLAAVLVLASGCSKDSDPASSPEGANTQTNTSTDTQATTSAQASVAQSAEVKQAIAQKPVDRTAWERTLISHWCLTNAGVKARINPNKPDSVRANIEGEGAEEKFFREDQRCNAEYQLGLYNEPTRADAAKEFTHRKKTASCMQGKGVVVSEPPSEASFIDDYLKSIKTGEDLQVWSPWDQYLENDNLDQAEYNQMLEDCPRIAPE